jgi:hypothetical protein
MTEGYAVERACGPPVTSRRQDPVNLSRTFFTVEELLALAEVAEHPG